MSRLSPLQIVAIFVGLALGGSLLYLTGRVLNQLSQEAIVMGTGALFTLAIVVVTALLFIIYGIVQSRLRRLELAQDDFDELKKMQMLLGVGGRVNYNFRSVQPPGTTNMGGALDPWPRQLPPGEYKDTTLDLE